MSMLDQAVARKIMKSLEHLETIRQGPTAEERSALDANARGDGEPGCRDCADYNGTCPHDGHKCGANDRIDARRDALRALTYKTDAITAELERLYRLIERELWSASQ